MISILSRGFLLGLSTGTTCVATCAPIYIPYLMLDKRDTKQSFLTILYITIGRFIAYAFFGAVVGLIGQQIPSGIRSYLTGFAFILLSIYLIFNIVRIQRHKKNCKQIKLLQLTKNPLLLGIITGLNFCPAFMIAIADAVDISGTFAGVILFVGFFIGTTIFFIPMIVFGVITTIKNFSIWIKRIAIVSGILVAVYFMYKGGNSIYTQVKKTIENKKLAYDNFLENDPIYVLEFDETEKWDSLSVKINKTELKSYLKELYDYDNVKDLIINLPNETAVIYDPHSEFFKSLAESQKAELDSIWIGKHFKQIEINLANFENSEEFDRVIKFLDGVVFKHQPGHGYKFVFNQPPAEKLEDNLH